MKYKILTASETDYLEDQVNDHLKDGWHLHAGVSISFNYCGQGGFSFTYAQVVLKDDVSIKEDFWDTALLLDRLNRSVYDLPFNKRMPRIFKRAKIKTVADLISMSPTELRKYANVGDKTLLHVVEILRMYGLALAKGDK
jgi:hypothetical protein